MVYKVSHFNDPPAAALCPGCQGAPLSVTGSELGVSLQGGKAWQPTPVFLPGEPHGQRSLAGYSSWAHKESGTTQ